MKYLTKRNLIVLALAGIVVIALLAVATFSQVSAGQLFGTVNTEIFVDPIGKPLYLDIGEAQTVSVRNGDTTCHWTATNPGAVYIHASRGSVITSSGVVNYLGASLTLTGRSSGLVTFNGTCNTGYAKKEVYVLPITMTPNLDGVTAEVNKTFTVSSNDIHCTWSTSDSAHLAIQGSNVGASVTVRGHQGQSDGLVVTLSANCSGHTVSKPLHIWWNYGI